MALTIAERKSRPDWTAKASSVDLSPFDFQQFKNRDQMRTKRFLLDYKGICPLGQHGHNSHMCTSFWPVLVYIYALGWLRLRRSNRTYTPFLPLWEHRDAPRLPRLFRKSCICKFPPPRSNHLLSREVTGRRLCGKLNTPNLSISRLKGSSPSRQSSRLHSMIIWPADRTDDFCDWIREACYNR